MNRSIQKQTGLTLIELMVSLVLSLFIVLALLGIFVTNRVSFQANESKAEMIDNTRFAMDLIGYDLKMAGSYGQLKKTGIVSFRRGDARLGEFARNVINDCGGAASKFYADTDRFIRITNNAALTNSNSVYGSGNCLNDYKNNTDVLIVRYADPVNVTSDAELRDNTIYIYSLFKEARIFDTTSRGGVIDYNKGQVNELKVHMYYISNNTSGSDGIPALKRRALTSSDKGPILDDELIASGVEDMQFLLNFMAKDGIARIPPEDDEELGKKWGRLRSINRIRSVSMWMVTRSTTEEDEFSFNYDFNMGGSQKFTVSNTRIPRTLVSNTFSIRGNILE